MFEKELKYIDDFNSNRIKKLGNFVTIGELSKANLHPAIMLYIAAEIDYLIYNDSNKLLQDSIFDYSVNAVTEYFNRIAEIIKRDKKFSADYLIELALMASNFNVTYLIQPKHTLAKFAFDDNDEIKVADIRQSLKYLYYYDYIYNILINYFNKKRIITISKSDFEEILSKIQNTTFEKNGSSVISNMLVSIGDFFNIGSATKTIAPVTAVQIFLHELGVTKLEKRIDGFRKSEDKVNLKIDDIVRVLFSESPVEVIGVEDVKEVEEPEIEEQPEPKEELNEESVQEKIIEELAEKQQQQEAKEETTESSDDFEEVEVEDEEEIEETEEATQPEIENEVDEESKDDQVFEVQGEEFDLKELDNNVISEDEKEEMESIPDENESQPSDEVLEDSTEMESDDEHPETEEIETDFVETEDEKETAVVENEEEGDKEKRKFAAIFELKERFFGSSENSEETTEPEHEEEEILEDSETVGKNPEENDDELIEIKNEESALEETTQTEDITPAEDAAEIEEESDFEEVPENEEFEEVEAEKEEKIEVIQEEAEPEVKNEDKDETEDRSEIEEEELIESEIKDLETEQKDDSKNKDLPEEDSGLKIPEAEEFEEVDAENEAEIEETQEEAEPEVKNEDKDETKEKDLFESTEKEKKQEIVDIEEEENKSRKVKYLPNGGKIRKIEVNEILAHKKINKIIDVIFDQDMDDFADAIDSLSECKNVGEALRMLELILDIHRIDPGVKEANIFKKIITDYYYT